MRRFSQQKPALDRSEKSESQFVRIGRGRELPALAHLLKCSLDAVTPDCVFNRGAWCPYCQAQLAGFQRASEKLAETGIKVVALSVDDEATTVGTIEKFKLSFPLGHSANADKVAAVTGAYINETDGVPAGS